MGGCPCAEQNHCPGGKKQGEKEEGPRGFKDTPPETKGLLLPIPHSSARENPALNTWTLGPDPEHGPRGSGRHQGAASCVAPWLSIIETTTREVRAP